MRTLLTAAALACIVAPAAAEENEAEKLFRAVEKKLHAARTLRARFEASVTIFPRTGKLSGTVTLGEGDRVRMDFEGKPFGEEAKMTLVSDGTRLSVRELDAEPSKVKPKAAPKGLGANFRASLLRQGVMISFNSLDRGGDLSPAALAVSDFKLGPKEKVGGREAQVIEYTVTRKLDVVTPPKSRAKLWLDAKTQLPVRLALTTRNEDITATTDTFSDFAIDPKVDAKLFEVPK